MESKCNHQAAAEIRVLLRNRRFIPAKYKRQGFGLVGQGL